MPNHCGILSVRAGWYVLSRRIYQWNQEWKAESCNKRENVKLTT
ncbi:hypothetical protein P879_07642 [Paragonimus westermani]|uniref:Uncharacterized protein n=1 Tax=Paragonimus westermani TaxID=34504 RepID=A0A8T0DFK2_9TREM|nr:hypothetical protein P879_07642 [Paragonimus westermani]